jgi:hypothetical protein
MLIISAILLLGSLPRLYGAQPTHQSDLVSVIGTQTESLEQTIALLGQIDRSDVGMYDPLTLLRLCNNPVVYEFLLDTITLADHEAIEIYNLQIIERYGKPDQLNYLKLLLNKLKQVPYHGSKFHTQTEEIFKMAISKVDPELTEAYLASGIAVGDGFLKLIDRKNPEAWKIVHRLLEAGATVDKDDSDLIIWILGLQELDLAHLKLVRQQGAPYWVKMFAVNLLEHSLFIGRMDFAVHLYDENQRLTDRCKADYPSYVISVDDFGRHLLVRTVVNHVMTLLLSLEDPNSSLDLPKDLLKLLGFSILELIVCDETQFHELLHGI